MSTAVAIWSHTIKAGQGIVDFESLPKDVRVTLITLDADLVDNERSSLKIHQVDEEDDNAATAFVAANLIPGKVCTRLAPTRLGRI